MRSEASALAGSPQSLPEATANESRLMNPAALEQRSGSCRIAVFSLNFAPTERAGYSAHRSHTRELESRRPPKSNSGVTFAD